MFHFERSFGQTITSLLTSPACCSACSAISAASSISSTEKSKSEFLYLRLNLSQFGKGIHSFRFHFKLSNSKVFKLLGFTDYPFLLHVSLWKSPVHSNLPICSSSSRSLRCCSSLSVISVRVESCSVDEFFSKAILLARGIVNEDCVFFKFE